MAWTVGSTVTQGFSTGTAGETWTVALSRDPAGASFLVSGDIAALGSGDYLLTFTPDTAGYYFCRVTGSVTGDYDFEWLVDATATVGNTAYGADYCTLAQLKARMGVTDTANDTVYAAVITAASRAIDAFCGRRFYQLTATARYFTAEHGSLLEVDDLVSVTTIAVDVAGVRDYSVTFQTTDYDLLPDNAADVGWPYTAIAIQPFSSEWFPTLRRGVKITGTWGWPSVPTDVTEACLLLAARLAKRPAAPFGGGTSDFGGAAVITPVDTDLVSLLSGYRSMRMGAV